MTQRLALLKWAVESAKPMISAQYPHGYVQCPIDQQPGMTELHNEGNVVAYFQNGDGKNFPVVPTDAGVAVVNAAAQAPQPQAAPQATQAAQPFNVKVEDNVPMPAAASRGFQAREGGNAIDRFGFDKLAIGQSFHLPPSNDPDKAKATHRVFSSTVSQANAKLHPKAFAVREVGADDPGGPGARVWRIADMTGPRPTRTKRAKAEAAPAAAPQPEAAPQGWSAPGQAQGQGAGFAPQAGFPAPGGFVPPGGAPQGFGQPAPGASPFPENMPPAGFGQGGPSFS